MPRICQSLIAGFLLLLPILFTAPAQAQATRTWVSGVGDDVNPCSRTAPCKTFAGAISKTAAGGEISVLDPGGFGAVTITKSISIVNDDSGEAGILASGTNGIIVNGAGAIVYLRGLIIDGGTPAVPGLNGIRFLNGSALHVERTIIKNFNAANGFGIAFVPTSAAELYISNTSIVNNNGAGGGGLLVQASGAVGVNAVLNEVQINNNSAGIRLDGAGSTTAMNLTASYSQVAGNTGNGVTVTSPGGGSALKALISNSAIVGNAGVGLAVDGAAGSGAGSAIARIGNSTVTSNVTGLSVANAGVLQSFKNNQIAGNGSDGTPVTAFPGPGGPLQ